MFISDSDEGNFVCRHVEQIRTAARDGDCAFGVNLDCRCGVSSISIESDQPVSNVLLERNNSNTNINCSNKFDKHDSLYTQIWTGFYFIKDKQTNAKKIWAAAPAYFSTFKNIEFKSKFLSKVKKPG